MAPGPPPCFLPARRDRGRSRRPVGRRHRAGQRPRCLRAPARRVVGEARASTGHQAADLPRADPRCDTHLGRPVARRAGPLRGGRRPGPGGAGVRPVDLDAPLAAPGQAPARRLRGGSRGRAGGGAGVRRGRAARGGGAGRPARRDRGLLAAAGADRGLPGPYASALRDRDGARDSAADHPRRRPAPGRRARPAVRRGTLLRARDERGEPYGGPLGAPADPRGPARPGRGVVTTASVGTLRWVERGTAAGLVWVVLTLGAHVLGGRPHPGLLAVAVAGGDSALWLLVDLPGSSRVSSWDRVATEPIRPPGEDPRLTTLERVVGGHFEGREVTDTLQRHLMALADQRLLARHGVSWRVDPELAGPLLARELLALQRQSAPYPRRSVPQIDVLLT